MNHPIAFLRLSISITAQIETMYMSIGNSKNHNTVKCSKTAIKKNSIKYLISKNIIKIQNRWPLYSPFCQMLTADPSIARKFHKHGGERVVP